MGNKLIHMTSHILDRYDGIVYCRNPNCEHAIREGELCERTHLGNSNKFAYYCEVCARQEVLVFQILPSDRRFKKRIRLFRRFNEVHRKFPRNFFNPLRVIPELVKYFEEQKGRGVNV